MIPESFIFTDQLDILFLHPLMHLLILFGFIFLIILILVSVTVHIIKKWVFSNRQLVVNVQAVKRIDNHFGGKLKLHLIPQFDGDLIVSRLKAIPFRQWLGQ